MSDTEKKLWKPLQSDLKHLYLGNYKAAVITSKVDNISLFLAKIIFVVAEMLFKVVKITFVVIMISF